MKKAIQHIVMAVFMISVFQLQAQNPEQSFETGNKHYADGQFQEAIDAYQKVLDSGKESAAVYYNLANAHYKLNNVAPSIYYYEKAKLLAPADPDIKNNAAFASKMKIDAITPLPENTIKKYYNNILNLLTTDGWAYTTVILAMFFVAFFLAYYFSYGTGRKRVFFAATFVALLLAGLSLMFAYNAFAKAEKDNPAIVFATESTVKSEPNLASTEAFILHEGTKVLILETVKNWKRIQIADGKSGWIPTTDIKEL
ncbi:tetratricopeptide repeat protein [Dokdonia sinensis]|uniref:Tetratricopeptide repeat protein n=1 Tax=Dokdonia sinensis TaxID=2479847 RepID=A0A3M0GGC2_9FLAO|nr:tetratricopeptide repeat protein [Dokdonia sinensis]RMB63338.1 tetratricopeptide repeat protein [Dokdonia sinensis]